MSLVARAHRPLFFLALGGFLILSVFLSLALGVSDVDLLGALDGSAPGDRLVLLHERLPRTLLAATVGASLAAAGLAFQAVLNNPLADPYIIGVAGGAADEPGVDAVDAGLVHGGEDARKVLMKFCRRADSMQRMPEDRPFASIISSRYALFSRSAITDSRSGFRIRSSRARWERSLLFIPRIRALMYP